jgi:hypothetical protein
LFAQPLPTKITEACQQVNTALTGAGCKIVSEDAPSQILVKQGSLWGMSPLSAKKTIQAQLTEVDGGTKVSYTSKMSADWNNITLIGSVFSVVLVGVCVWMTLDLTSFLSTQKPSFWSWLVTVHGSANLAIGHSFVNLTMALAVFLSAVIAVETFDFFYVRKRIDKFAQKILVL